MEILNTDGSRTPLAPKRKSDDTSAQTPPAKKQRARSRSFVFTVNNYTDAEVAALQETIKGCLYVVFNQEKAPQTGTPHLQGFLHFGRPVDFNTVHKLPGLERAFLAPARNTKEAIRLVKLYHNTWTI